MSTSPVTTTVIIAAFALGTLTGWAVRAVAAASAQVDRLFHDLDEAVDVANSGRSTR